MNNIAGISERIKKVDGETNLKVRHHFRCKPVPLNSGKNGRRNGHGNRATGAVEPWPRSRAAALERMSSGSRRCDACRRRHVPGKVVHTIGCPLSWDTYGGRWEYPMADGPVSVGFFVGLDYKNPWLEPYCEFQCMKPHPPLPRAARLAGRGTPRVRRAHGHRGRAPAAPLSGRREGWRGGDEIRWTGGPGYDMPTFVGPHPPATPERMSCEEGTRGNASAAASKAGDLR
ncbi:hypothetical protein DFH09DRAFT_1083219 [Mycena vulgaris]|nr:hypothetical protein DFH09DRAFT_1083219 [Mycena vulgaris]